MGLAINETDNDRDSAALSTGAWESTAETLLQFINLLEICDLLPDPDLVGPGDDCSCPLTADWEIFKQLPPLSCPAHQTTTLSSRLHRAWFQTNADVDVVKFTLGPKWTQTCKATRDVRLP